ncbi:MAG: hypothetical protein RJA07_2553 [Bacteroidota bacterium]|jgi:O-antigen/teichoic acid export membrane protein
MNNLFNTLKQSSFFKNVSTLVGGTAIAQAISFGLYYFIAKIYSPSDFGTFSIITSSASIVAIIATGRFDMAIMLPHDENKVKKLYRVALHTSLIASLAIFIFIALAKIISVFGFEVIHYKVSNYFFWIPLLVFSIAAYQTTTVYLSRLKEYKLIAASRILNTASNGLATIFFGLLKLSYIGLVIGFFLSYVASWFLVYKKVKLILQDVKSVFSIKQNLATAKEYKQFPMFNVPQALIDALQFNMLIFLFNYFYSNEQVGQISFALRILQVPVSFIGASMAQVFFQQVSEKVRNNNPIHQLVKRIALICIGIFLPVWALFYFQGEFVFTLLFKSKWSQAGQFSSLLITWMFADFIRSPLSQLAVIFKVQKKWLLLSFISNFLIFASLLISFYYFHEVNKVLSYTGIVASIGGITLVIWIINLSSNYTKKIND